MVTIQFKGRQEIINLPSPQYLDYIKKLAEANQEPPVTIFPSNQIDWWYALCA